MPRGRVNKSHAKRLCDRARSGEVHDLQLMQLQSQLVRLGLARPGIHRIGVER